MTFAEPQSDVPEPASIFHDKSINQLEDDVNNLVYALGAMVGTIIQHKLDIEDEAYEEIMYKVSKILDATILKL